MSNLTKSRRMPVKYCVRPGGITEISYSATPLPIVADEPQPEVRLPGTRWLEVRRAREQRLATAVDTKALPKGKSWAGRIGTAASRLVQVVARDRRARGAMVTSSTSGFAKLSEPVARRSTATTDFHADGTIRVPMRG